MKTAVSTQWQLGTAPGRFPALEHPLQMLLRPLGFLTSLRSCGDLVKLRLGPEWAYFVQHPELIKQVLMTDHYIFDKGGPFFDTARSIAGNGILTCPNQDHPRQRRLMQPLFTHDRLLSYVPVMTEESRRTAASWHSGQLIEVGKAMSALTLSITTRTLFSLQAPTAMVQDVQHALTTLFAGLYQRMIIPVQSVHKLPTANNRAFDQAITQLPAIIDQMISEYRRAGVSHGDLLSTLLAAHDDETHGGLSDLELREQVMALLTAGTDTTAAALTSTFYLLNQHPQIARRLHAEVDAVLAGRAAEVTDLDKLDYTQRVFTEALRLYPPGWILTRRTSAAVELGGHRLAAGTTVLLSPYALQRDPRFFPDPERFDPDRWLPERAKAVPRYAMLPFSAGKRKCMGDAFASNLGTVILATLAARWRLCAVPATKVRTVPKMTLSVEALPMRAELRYPDRAPT